MKIITESRRHLADRLDLAEKISRVLALVEAEYDGGRLESLKSLVDALRDHTPLSYLLAPDTGQAVEWLRALFDLIESRTDEVAVRFLPFGQEGYALLVTNAPDAPFLVDSVQDYLSRQGRHFHIVTHPILTVNRRAGKAIQIGDLDLKGPRESLMVVELEGGDRDKDPALAAGVEDALRTALEVERDQAAIWERFNALAADAETESAREFWSWLRDGNFVPLGCRGLEVRGRDASSATVLETEGAALGIPFDPQQPSCCNERPLLDFSPTFRKRLLRREQVVVGEEERRSPVLRSDPLVYLGFREKGEGEEWREHAFLGLFTEKSIDEPAFNVPPLRRRIEEALKTLWVPPGCHDWRKTVEIFNNFPKIELFFMAPEELVEAVRSFTLLLRRGRIKVAAMPSMDGESLTLLVLMPREFYSPETMHRYEAYLCRHFQVPGVSSRVIHIASEYLSLHVRVQPEREEVRLDLERLERGLTHIARPWDFKLRDLVESSFRGRRATSLWEEYREAFPQEYRAMVHPRFAIRDVRNLEAVRATGKEVLDLWGPFGGEPRHYRLQFYSQRESYLNELMPLLENLNLSVIEEADFNLSVGGEVLYIKSFSVRRAPEEGRPLSAIKDLLLEGLGALRSGELENDYLNRLLVMTGLSWREIDIFRGYRNYYFQLGSPYTKRRVAFALIHNPQVALLLYRYFEARFKVVPEWEDLLRRQEEALYPIRQELISALESVSDINEDNILRTLFNLIDSTVRTNFFLRLDRDDYFFSFKISALGIIDMPAPRPMFEIYVHSATMEGIHLRGGKVARGGLRWSDRPDDFRTEVLGLMKTQMTKNALIVPVGSKGGFVVKTPFADREEGAALSKAAYQMFIRGLLDLTDNLVEGRVVRPVGVVAYDEEDPYLVVAADKGTAHLPDTANAVSAEYGFWLGDAFASGGSQGYDHKELAITARGAWECVKRHFRELGRDIQKEPFTAVGIGDMSGDVFGNGMLLSEQIRLLAAFDHRHIFLDPDPDPAISYRERKRLFGLPRSSWDDYAKDLISPGGGLFPRNAKDIPLSAEIRKWLGVRHASIDGPGLIRLLLCAEVDLLWNGGIGTYVKASSEKDEDADDRANDAVRIDANQLRARVVGEGGNLGFTQRARIEYALGGGGINTDAIDNSAGVDCSDHEVNLKIFMAKLAEQGRLSGAGERNRLLDSMAEEVCADVLRNNYGQSLCLSLDLLRCAEDVEPFLDLADRLGSVGLLDRRGEFLPTVKEVSARAGHCLTRPELAILLAYAKMQLYQALLESDLPQGEGARGYLESYFPDGVREAFFEQLGDHPLAREITATVITNALVNQAGCSFAHQASRRTGRSIVEVTRTYLAFDRILGGAEIRQGVFDLDNRMAAAEQHRCLRLLEGALVGLCEWALLQGMPVALEDKAIGALRESLRVFEKNLGGIVPEQRWQGCQQEASQLEEAGLDPELARWITLLPFMEDFLPAVSLAENAGVDLYSTMSALREVGESFGTRQVVNLLGQVQVRDRWDRQAQRALKDAFSATALDLTRAVLTEAGGNLEGFIAPRRHKVNLYRRMRERLGENVPPNLHPFSVLADALGGLLR
ncbi:NAD-glutamate dehydrogenase domain-containing protein [uncultured Desulfuromonas sp.]|uniref:NAD-glutamate dehydrogenase domain-containing protein n=1 Tax=uncultured Desulfuromonas sp. TaxID=181013 RepID=UPI0026113E19|nr:NAD-glutamate dehydrogenase domain-containing protein [uncultured Desulfuromonas sp.]